MAINGMIRKTSASFPPRSDVHKWSVISSPPSYYANIILRPSTIRNDREADWVVHANAFSVLSCPPATLYRECSIHMSVPPVEALAFFRAPSATGARCQCFETALQTLSKLWSVLPATRTVFSAVRAVLVRWTSHPRGHLVLLTKVSSMVYTFFLKVMFMDWSINFMTIAFVLNFCCGHFHWFIK